MNVQIQKCQGTAIDEYDRGDKRTGYEGQMAGCSTGGCSTGFFLLKDKARTTTSTTANADAIIIDTFLFILNFLQFLYQLSDVITVGSIH